MSTSLACWCLVTLQALSVCWETQTRVQRTHVDTNVHRGAHAHSLLIADLQAPLGCVAVDFLGFGRAVLEGLMHWGAGGMSEAERVIEQRERRESGRHCIRVCGTAIRAHTFLRLDYRYVLCTRYNYVRSYTSYKVQGTYICRSMVRCTMYICTCIYIYIILYYNICMYVHVYVHTMYLVRCTRYDVHTRYSYIVHRTMYIA